jgi:hypothetical protein
MKRRGAVLLFAVVAAVGLYTVPAAPPAGTITTTS